MDVKECNSQYLINSDSFKGNHHHNQSFDINYHPRALKSKKKKEEANKALLNFEEMKKKIMKDYAKKPKKEAKSKGSKPSHNRHTAGPISGYFNSQKEDSLKYDKHRDSQMKCKRDEDSLFTNENHSKKNIKKQGSKHSFATIYDANNFGNWGPNVPLSQKSINLGGIALKTQPSRNKKHTPSKSKGPRSTFGQKRKSKCGNIENKSCNYISSHKPTKSTSILTSSKIHHTKPKSGSKKEDGRCKGQRVKKDHESSVFEPVPHSIANAKTLL